MQKPCKQKLQYPGRPVERYRRECCHYAKGARFTKCICLLYSYKNFGGEEMANESMYYSISHLYPYGRNFNFVNGVRSIGKTYGTYKDFIGRALKEKCEFVVICRTQEEKKRGYLQKAVSKVIQNEYPQMLTQDEKYLQFNPDMMIAGGRCLGRCIALTEAVKIKKEGFPNIKYGIFDEYAVEEDNTAQRYVNGWDEPDLFLSIYHTIDREEDRVIFFLMGNNISAYNPYHLHKAFRIPYVEHGKIWKSQNVLFENVEITEALRDKKSKCRFLNMIQGTEYGDMADGGMYIYDSDNLIDDIPISDCNPFCTLIYNKQKYGVWRARHKNALLISDKFNPTYRAVYAILPSDVSTDVPLIERKHGHAGYIGTAFKLGLLRFSGQEIKKRFTEIIPYFL